MRHNPPTLLQDQRLSLQYECEQLGAGVQLELSRIPSGCFQMGSVRPDSEPDSTELPQHPVQVEAFLLGKFAVTQTQWAQVAALPKVALDLDPDPSFCKGAERPVDSVSWYEAMEFCARLSRYTGKHYRLPSEAEWEYACRGQTQSQYHFGDQIHPEWANYSPLDDLEHSTHTEYCGQSTPVGYFGTCNSFGLYDMHGNVWEWCADPWHERYRAWWGYQAPTDGQVWDAWHGDRYHDVLGNIQGLVRSERSRVTRGGSWFNTSQFCRSASRYHRYAFVKLGHQGFRVCCSLAKS
ncbi:MAG: formylglycine-generating enzyme family protein [Spirulina sp. SIO3F2]|nr:formylglycine-generating enzyme family protein [Spirulina sp. SIO3F2]